MRSLSYRLLAPTFASPAAATATEIVAWLNGTSAIFTYNERDFHPVDDLVAGTYMINLEFADRGNNTSGVPGSYRTPSVAVATFQVKQAAVEKAGADIFQQVGPRDAVGPGGNRFRLGLRLGGATGRGR